VTGNQKSPGRASAERIARRSKSAGLRRSFGISHEAAQGDVLALCEVERLEFGDLLIPER